MAEEYIDIEYSAEDIERYLRGQMSAKDMHNLERAALQDPFLADAIEGYQHAPFAQTYQHLEDISAAILGEKKQAKIVPLPVKANYYWWQAAVVAGIIIIIGGGLLWFSDNQKNVAAMQHNLASVPKKQKRTELLPAPNAKAINENPDVAKAREKQFSVAENQTIVSSNSQKDSSETVALQFVPAQPRVPPQPGRIESKLNDTIAAVNPSDAYVAGNTSGLVAQSPATDDKLIAIAPKSLFYRKEDSSSLIGVKKSSNNIISYNVNNAEPQTFKAKALKNNFVTRINPKVNGLQGYVFDEKQQALGNAIVYSDKGKQMALTDNNGYFKLNVADSQLTVQVSSAGYQTTQMQLKNNITNYVTVNELPLSASNKVELVAFGNSKKFAKRLQADSLFPEGGWQSFREYVYKKLHKEKEMDTTGAEITYMGNTVEIEFVVDENGIARDLKITRSVNEKIDAKALEVVQQWPKWIATRKNKIGKVVIQF